MLSHNTRLRRPWLARIRFIYGSCRQSYPGRDRERRTGAAQRRARGISDRDCLWPGRERSEEHTSELQSQSNLVCRLLLEKKNYQYTWDFGASGTCSGSSTSHTYETGGSYSVTVTVTDEGGQFV